MSFVIAFHAAQACSQSARHQVLERGFALCAGFFGIPGHGHHHRFWPARGYAVERLAFQHGMLRNESAFAGLAVFGSYKDSSIFFKLIELQQVFR